MRAWLRECHGVHARQHDDHAVPGWWLQAQVCDFTSRERLAAILDYMSDHAAEATLEGTAAHFNYHPNTVSGLLRRESRETSRRSSGTTGWSGPALS